MKDQLQDFALDLLNQVILQLLKLSVTVTFLSFFLRLLWQFFLNLYQEVMQQFLLVLEHFHIELFLLRVYVLCRSFDICPSFFELNDEFAQILLFFSLKMHD